MSHITLIRHGQANSTATDEAGYDRLSDLGHQQSSWLGAYLKDQNQHHVRLYTGTLRRHVETAASMDIAHAITAASPTVRAVDCLFTSAASTCCFSTATIGPCTLAHRSAETTIRFSLLPDICRLFEISEMAS